MRNLQTARVNKLRNRRIKNAKFQRIVFMRTQTHWEIFKSALVVSIGKTIVYFIEKLVFLCFTLKSSYCGNFATPRKIVDASVLRLFARTVLAKTSMAGPTFSTATESNQAPVLKLYRCNCIYPLFCRCIE